MPISGIFGYRILPSGKIRARKAQSKKSQMDFFDKLGRPSWWKDALRYPFFLSSSRLQNQLLLYFLEYSSYSARLI